MTVFCRVCGSRNIRPSHFQFKDFRFLLTLRYPVRCRACRKRFVVSIFRIRRVRRDAEARRAGEMRILMSQAVALGRQSSEHLH